MQLASNLAARLWQGLHSAKAASSPELSSSADELDDFFDKSADEDLLTACISGDLALVKHLVAAGGADIDTMLTGVTPLCTAAYQGHKARPFYPSITLITSLKASLKSQKLSSQFVKLCPQSLELREIQ